MTTAALSRAEAGEVRDHIRAMYRDVAERPRDEFHFEMGRPLAERLGYPAGWLDARAGAWRSPTSSASAR